MKYEIEFEYIAFENYITYKDYLKIPLKDLGVVWVTGNNKDSKGSSNGAAKSRFADFIRVMCFETVTDSVLFGDKNFVGEICWVRKAKRVRVFQFRKLDKKRKLKLAEELGVDEKSFKNSGYLIFVDGKNVTKHTSAECKKQVQDLLGLTQDELLGTVYVTPSRAYTLVAGTSPQRRQYFEGTFSVLTNYKTVQEKVKDKRDDLRDKVHDLELIESELSVLESQLLECKDQDVLEGLLQNLTVKYDAIKEERTELQTKIKDIESKINAHRSRKEILAQLEDLNPCDSGAAAIAKAHIETLREKAQTLKTTLSSINEFKELNTEFSDVKTKLKDKKISSKLDYEKEISALESEIGKADAEYEAAQNLYNKFNKLKSHNCPTCSQTVDLKFVESSKKKAAKDSDIANDKIEVANFKLKLYKDAFKLIKKYNELKKALGKFGEVKDEKEITSALEKNKLKIKDLTKKIETYDKAKSLNKLLEKYPKQDLPNKDFYIKLKERSETLQPKFELILKEKTEYEIQLKTVKKLKVQVKEYKGKLIKLPKYKRLLGIYESLFVAYGDRGLKVKQITNLCQKLVEQLPKYTHLMFQENIKFTTDLDKDTFDIIAHRNFEGRKKKIDIREFSTGESKRLIPSLMLAQNAILPKEKRCNLFLADELDSGLDAIPKLALVNNLIPELRKKYGTVIMITHSPEIKPENCRHWIVSKSKGISKLEMK